MNIVFTPDSADCKLGATPEQAAAVTELAATPGSVTTINVSEDGVRFVTVTTASGSDCYTVTETGAATGWFIFGDDDGDDGDDVSVADFFPQQFALAA